MGITVEELTTRLNAEADRRGLSPIRLIEHLLAQMSEEDDGVPRDVTPLNWNEVK
jgi:hypothetical protein